MPDRAGGSIELQKPRGIARLDRSLGNQLRRQVIVELAGLHLFAIRMMMFKMIVARILRTIMLTRGKKQPKFWV